MNKGVQALAHLSKTDAKMRALIKQVGVFRLKKMRTKNPYESLFRSIVFQQLHAKAAETIFSRVLALYEHGSIPSPQELLKTKETHLRQAGLSRNKLAAVRDLAQKTMEGVVPERFIDLKVFSDEEIISRLSQVRGVGAWTVEMMLIFRMGRKDVLPVHDYAIRKAFQKLYRKRALPKPQEMIHYAERWRPYRTVASWYLWRSLELED